jgi:hypothetical protein
MPITPADRLGACVDYLPSRAAFPVIQSGRHPRFHFRGLLRLHSRYGPSDCSTAQGGLCHEASVRPVTQPNRSSATRPIDNYLGGTFLHWRYAPSGRTERRELSPQAIEGPASQAAAAHRRADHRSRYRRNLADVAKELFRRRHAKGPDRAPLHVGDRAQLAWLYSAPMAGNLSAVDKDRTERELSLLYLFISQSLYRIPCG